MKTKTTAEQISAILKALEKIHVRPFQMESCDSKHDAQRNLRGRTHYVDDETLRWHKSRVTSSTRLHSGLLYRVTCSDAIDPDNRKRGFRAAVFDVFGTCIDRPKLEEAFKTRQKAIEHSEAQEIDLLAHYRQALTEIHKHKLDEAKETETALAILTP